MEGPACRQDRQVLHAQAADAGGAGLRLDQRALLCLGPGAGSTSAAWCCEHACDHIPALRPGCGTWPIHDGSTSPAMRRGLETPQPRAYAPPHPSAEQTWTCSAGHAGGARCPLPSRRQRSCPSSTATCHAPCNACQAWGPPGATNAAIACVRSPHALEYPKPSTPRFS